MRKTILAGIAVVMLAAPSAESHSVSKPESLTRTIEKDTTPECLSFSSTPSSYGNFSDEPPAKLKVLRIDNGCNKAFRLEPKSCAVESCEVGCEDLACDGEAIRVAAGDAAEVDTGVPSGGGDAASADADAAGAGDTGSTTDAGPSDTGRSSDASDPFDAGDAEANDAGDTAGGRDTSDGGGSGEPIRETDDVNERNYFLRDTGIERSDFNGGRGVVDATFDWRMEQAESGELEIGLEYRPATGPSGDDNRTPRTGCGCQAGPAGGAIRATATFFLMIAFAMLLACRRSFKWK